MKRKNTKAVPVDDFVKALAFTKKTHSACLDRIKQRSKGLVASFDDFYDEYTYVVVASGFRARVAAAFAPKLIACNGDYSKMIQIFGNHSKVDALSQMFARKSQWSQLRAEIAANGVDGLEALPRIGPTTKFHLARNIGLQSCVKPDLHLTRYSLARGYDDALSMCKEVKAVCPEARELLLGEIDFCFFVWLSHQNGVANDDCCNGKLRMR